MKNEEACVNLSFCVDIQLVYVLQVVETDRDTCDQRRNVKGSFIIKVNFDNFKDQTP